MSERIYPLNVTGLPAVLTMAVHDGADKHVSFRIAQEGIWEPYETQLVMERLTPGAVFVDVGANIGYYSVIAATIVGSNGQVYAFEPDPENFSLLEKNARLNALDNIAMVDAALSDCSGSGALYLNTDNYGDHQVYDNGQGRNSREITLINGADYFVDKQPRVDLVKIDTQGAEYHVVKGLLPLLQASGSSLSMIVEFWPFGLRKAGASANELLDLLVSLGLDFFVIDHIGHQLEPCSEQQLREWVQMVETDPSDEGFMNILIGH